MRARARLFPLKPTLVSALGALAMLALPLAHAADRAVGSLRLIGEQRIPSGEMFRDTAVGGLSGLDYDAASDTWYLLSDDRSEKAPARFYTARLDLDAEAFRGITLTGVSVFTQQDGKPYPSRLRQVLARGEIADFESIRIDPTDRSLWYTSEGDCLTTFRDPSITHGSATGAFIARIEPPPMLRLCHPIGSGSRFNATFEGLTFSADGRTLWVSMEGPTHEDGPLPTPEQGAFGRVTEFARDGAVLRQVAYPIDAVVPVPAKGKHGENGVSDMLAVDENRFLMIERGAAQDENGRWSNDIRIYEMNIRDATDVREVPALREGTFKPATKRLVLNLKALALQRLDNIEGIAWGPKLPNGHDTIVLVSDDNFHPPQITQLLAFEVLPPVN